MRFLLPCLLLLAACDALRVAPGLPTTTPEPSAVVISLKQVSEAIEAANLPIIDKVVYNESSDPNHLLGRPGQYVEKMNFRDRRDKTNKEGSIEVFRSPEDAERRKTYIDTIAATAPMFGSYSYIHKNVLLRVSLGVPPADAEAYKVALESL